ncbi:MAG: DNA polymerase III subunit gamma/tau [Spirochaetota bacterium]|nr:DNA polymerase III subunit gamma/tau [Spirochaetota bacterium]
MTYQVIARKWRPQNFDEIIFQNHISRTIRNSIKKGRVSHAYLFAGPKGVGKTTMARVLSKALNCNTGLTDSPCGKCENCVEIRQGSSFDVIEIDGASNRGIEDVRELRENVNFAPIKCRYKIYIIDEVHMLTKEAFNALLKTLEEPPRHVVFVFATTEIHRIPETILSRCQKYSFKKIPNEFIVDHLKRIVESEGYNILEGALYQIARASEGSMRDAQSLIDQLIAFSEGEIDESDALAILGVMPLESYLSLLRYIGSLDAKQTMSEVDRIVTLGADINGYVTGFIDILRTLRLVGCGVSVKDILGFSDDEMDRIKDAANLFCDEELSVLFRIASELMSDLRFSFNERISLEMALLDMINVKKGPSIAAILKKLEEASKGNESLGAPPSSHGEDKKDKMETGLDKSNSVVERIREVFQGQIIEKGDK